MRGGGGGEGEEGERRGEEMGRRGGGRGRRGEGGGMFSCSQHTQYWSHVHTLSMELLKFCLTNSFRGSMPAPLSARTFNR